MSSTEGKKPEAGKSDDWAAAVDEWDATLDLPVDELSKQSRAEAQPSRDEVAVSEGDRTPIPGEGPSGFARPETTAVTNLPPLPAPPAAEPDPLKDLLDIDIALAAMPGEALGSLLGAPTGAAAAGAEPLPLAPPPEDEELTFEWQGGDEAREVRTPRPGDEPRLAEPVPADDLVLPDEIPVDPIADVESETTVTRSAARPAPAAAPGTADDDLDLDVVVERVAGPEPAAPTEPASTLPSGRHVAPDVLARLKSAIDSLDENIFGGGPEPAAAAVPAALQTDSDFYDDISIENPPEPALSPAAAAAAAQPVSELEFNLDLDLGVETSPAPTTPAAVAAATAPVAATTAPVAAATAPVAAATAPVAAPRVTPAGGVAVTAPVRPVTPVAPVAPVAAPVVAPPTARPSTPPAAVSVPPAVAAVAEAAPAEPRPAPPAAEPSAVDVLDFAVDLEGTLSRAGVTVPVAPAAPAAEVAAPAAPPPVVRPSRRLVDQPAPAAKLPHAVALPSLAVAAEGPAPALEPAAVADQIRLLDDERALCQDAARAAELACIAGRLAERVGDAETALVRFEAALDLQPEHPAALRGLRRLALAGQNLDGACELLEREIERAAERERPGLLGLRAELLLAAGAWDAARAVYEGLLAARPTDVGARSGVLDAACASGDAAAQQAALGDLAAAVRDLRFEAVLRTESGRQAELAGDDEPAAAAYRAAAQADASAIGPSLGLLRVALRGGSPADRIAAQERLAELSGGGIAAACARRVALEQLAAGDAVRAADSLAAAPVSDVPTIAVRALAQEAAGRGAASAATLEQLAAVETDPERRADVLIRLGELHERMGAAIDAAHAYERAAEAAPGDLRAQKAALRASRARGDLDRLIEAARREAARAGDGADVAHVRAARWLVEQGRTADAVAALGDALAQNPRNLTAAADLVELHLAAGQPALAAQVLARAADAEGDPDLAAADHERAARLYARAGAVDEALALVAKLRDTGVSLPAGWLEQRVHLAAGLAGDVALADAAALEAEISADSARSASLWHLRGLALEATQPDAALDAHRRALSLAPGHPGALTALSISAARAGDVAELVAIEQARIAAAGDRPEAIALRLRLAALHEQSQDPASAAQVYQELLALVPAEQPLSQEVEELYAAALRRAGDFDRAAEVEAHLVERLPAGLERTARALRLAELNELRLGRADAAVAGYAAVRHDAERFARAGHLRALVALGRTDEVVEQLRAEAAAASDVTSRVAAWQELADLHANVRGDLAAAESCLHEIVALDHANHPAYRALERQYIAAERWADLVHLYEQMGLGAGDPALAVALFLDLARLRERLGTSDLRTIDNDHRRALYRDGTCRPALRRVAALARESRDHGLVADLYSRLAQSEPGPRTAAAFATRAGEALEQLGRADAAVARYRTAADKGQYLVALRLALRLAVTRESWADAAWAASTAGALLHDPTERARAHLVAGRLYQVELADAARAQTELRAVLATDPHNRDAFERLRALLAAEGDHAALAPVLAARIDVETDPSRLTALHLELGALYRDRLAQRDLARQQFRRVLAHDAGHAAALVALSDLHYEDQQWTEAADVLIRRARLEKDPTVLKDIFFKLGLIYDTHTPDTRRALVSFTRVLSYDPENRVALEHLARLYAKDEEWKNALGATSRLASLETDPARKVELYHRIARIHEDGLKDARAAHEAYRRAVDVDPQYLPAIGELSRFYERQGDITSARVHLDRSVQATRAQLARSPDDPAPYHALYKIFEWRRSHDQAITVAQILKAMGQANDDEQALLARFASHDGYPGPALGDPTLDEQLFTAAVPPGFRQLFRLLDETLQKAYRSDVKRLGVGRNEKLPARGHAVRDVANKIAADLGVREFDVYVSTAAPRVCAVELTEPLSLVFGADLIAGLHEHELRFFLGRFLKMIASSMAVPLRLSGEELGVLVGGVVRQFVPDFVPRGFEQAAVVAEAARLARVIPRKLHQELLPFALECADPSLDLRVLAGALVHTANRAGVLCAGSVPPAMSALKRLGDADQVRELYRFAVSDELSELRRTVGTAIG